jgi:hypothetical protein
VAANSCVSFRWHLLLRHICNRSTRFVSCSTSASYDIVSWYILHRSVLLRHSYFQTRYFPSGNKYQTEIRLASVALTLKLKQSRPPPDANMSLSTLPDELSQRVIDMLGPYDLVSLAYTCTTFHARIVQAGNRPRVHTRYLRSSLPPRVNPIDVTRRNWLYGLRPSARGSRLEPCIGCERWLEGKFRNGRRLPDWWAIDWDLPKGYDSVPLRSLRAQDRLWLCGNHRLQLADPVLTRHITSFQPRRQYNDQLPPGQRRYESAEGPPRRYR